MHPAMAVWIWSMTMSRVWQATLMGEEYRPGAHAHAVKGGAGTRNGEPLSSH